MIGKILRAFWPKIEEPPPEPLVFQERYKAIESGELKAEFRDAVVELKTLLSGIKQHLYALEPPQRAFILAVLDMPYEFGGMPGLIERVSEVVESKGILMGSDKDNATALEIFLEEWETLSEKEKGLDSWKTIDVKPTG